MRRDRLAEPENAEHVRTGGGEALPITAKRAEVEAVKVREPFDQSVSPRRATPPVVGGVPAPGGAASPSTTAPA
jgi:hypothetical protein